MFECTEYDVINEEAIERYMKMPIEELEREMLEGEEKERRRLRKSNVNPSNSRGLKTL